jgi:hypothetical protein
MEVVSMSEQEPRNNKSIGNMMKTVRKKPIWKNRLVSAGRRYRHRQAS